MPFGRPCARPFAAKGGQSCFQNIWSSIQYRIDPRPRQIKLLSLGFTVSREREGHRPARATTSSCSRHQAISSEIKTRVHGRDLEKQDGI